MATWRFLLATAQAASVVLLMTAAAQADRFHGGHHHGGHHHGGHHHGGRPHFSFGIDFRPRYYDYYYAPYPRYVYVPAPVYAPPVYAPVYSPYGAAPSVAAPVAAVPSAASPVTAQSDRSSSQPTLAAATGRVQVSLPDPDGEVWIDGRKASGSGTMRMFQFAPGQNEKSRSIKVTAAWHEDGRLVSRERTVEASAGQTTKVDLIDKWEQQAPSLSSNPKEDSAR